ncbi:MAG: deoxynucleoside kinase [Steroidobacteraceae bacterium]
MARGKYIAIAGNIGAGKTELTEFLCRRYGLEPFYEPNEANPYLADFYADMRAWALQSQLFFLAHKFRLHQQLQEQDRAVIQDRTIYEDAEIFARNLHLQRLIPKRDFETYWTLYEGLRHALRPPDLMIQLRCPVRTLRQRIRRRGRGYEQDMPARYLSRLNRLYEEWFQRYDLSPVLVLDTDRLDYLTDLVDRVDLFERIEQHLGG